MMMPTRRQPGPGGMMVSSLLLHLALGFLVVTFRLFPEAHPPEETTYYVDMVSLPVANPQKGDEAPTPAPNAGKPAAPQPKPAPVHPAPKPSPSTMILPVAKAKPAAPKKQGEQPSKALKAAPDQDESQAFQERIAKLERQAEEKRQADVLARLRAGKGGKVGSASGKGTESGSDYAAWIHSRLRDAFVQTIAYETKTPQVVARLTIGADGRLVQYRVERSTGDKIFEDAVERAVHIAEKSFRKPPNGAAFEQGFVFKPQGVGIK